MQCLDSAFADCLAKDTKEERGYGCDNLHSNARLREARFWIPVHLGEGRQYQREFG